MLTNVFIIVIVIKSTTTNYNKKTGSGTFEVNGVEHEVSVGTFLLMAPHEKHGIWVPKDQESALKVVVTGVVVGERK